MMKIQFLKDKYGKELLVDCFNISEIAGRTFSLKELHSSNFYEIYFFSEGGGSIHLEADKLDIAAPAILMVRPLQPKRWSLKGKPDCMMVIFEGDFMEAFMKDANFLNRLYLFRSTDVPPLLPVAPEEMTSYKQLLSNIQQEIKKQEADGEHLLRAYLYQLLILLNRSYISHYQLKEGLYNNLEMLRFKGFIQQHIREKQTVKEYAELLKITRNRLTQLCQEFFGKDAQTIIHNELLKSCKNELLLTTKTIAEISYEYNFSAPSNFIRFFKTSTKVSPAVYRKEYAN